MQYGWDWYPAKAILAGKTFAKERRRGAERTVVVECLYDRNTRTTCGPKGGRAWQRKRVVEVHDIRTKALDRISCSRIATTRPNNAEQQRPPLQDSPSLDLVAARLQPRDRASRIRQETSLLLDDGVLAARLGSSVAV